MVTSLTHRFVLISCCQQILFYSILLHSILFYSILGLKFTYNLVNMYMETDTIPKVRQDETTLQLV